MMHTFRAIWPITDPTLSLRELARQGAGDLPGIALESHAYITGKGQFRIAPGNAVPGSRGSDWVLIYEAPARKMPSRAYWRAA